MPINIVTTHFNFTSINYNDIIKLGEKDEINKQAKKYK